MFRPASSRTTIAAVVVGPAPFALVAVLASPPFAVPADPARAANNDVAVITSPGDPREDHGEGDSTTGAPAKAPTRSAATLPNAAASRTTPRGVDAPRQPSGKRRATPRDWPFLLALGVTGLQVPIVRPSVVRLDPRATGRATTMIGGAASLRWVPRVNDTVRGGPWIGLDVGFRSGSVRFRDATEEGAADSPPPATSQPNTLSSAKVAHDVFAFETAALLYLAKSQFARLAVDAGGGGMVQLVRYDLAADDASQRFGSGFVRLGATVEVLVSRVAFVFDLRGYGVVTDRRAVVSRGAVFSDEAKAANPERARAPVATMQTMLVGSAGLAVRF